MPEQRPQFSAGVRPFSQESHPRGRQAMSFVPHRKDNRCEFYGDIGRCRGYKAKETDYCVGHARHFGLIEVTTDATVE